MSEWKQTETGNFIHQTCEDFALSYNPSCMINMAGEPETAIIDYTSDKRPKYYILYGDWREEMVEVANLGGLQALKNFFVEHVKDRSSWSDKIEEEQRDE